jgi:hypothetical protein
MMFCTSQNTGAAEAIGAQVLRRDRRLRVTIGVDPAQRIVSSHASHQDVPFPHVRRQRVRDAVRSVGLSSMGRV